MLRKMGNPMICRYGSLMVALTALASLPGCAALINGRTQEIAINTDPPGAQCRLTRENMVIATVPQTPAIVRVNRSPADIIVDCRREGHADARQQMKSSMDGMVFGNIVGAGLMGLGVDSATNADRQYDSSVTLTLLPASGKPAAAAAEPRQVAQAGPAAVGDVSQASWVAQRTAAANATHQVPTAPVGYVPPPPDKPMEKAKPAEAGPVDIRPAAARSAAPAKPDAKPADAKPAEVKPTAAMTPKPAPPKSAPSGMMAAAKPAAPPGSGLWHAHLASHRTEGAAITEWQELLKKDPKLYGQFDPMIEWVDIKDRGSFARLLIGAWAERKEADAACAKIRGPRRYCAAIKD